MPNRRKLQCVLTIAAVAALAGCGLLGGRVSLDDPPAAAPVAPPVARPSALVKTAGDTVTVDDERSGSPVEVRLDQHLLVRLRYEFSSAAQWELVDFTPGAFAAPGPSRFANPNGEAAIALGGEQIWRFAPAAAGLTTLTFAYRMPHSREAAIRTAAFTVTVR